MGDMPHSWLAKFGTATEAIRTKHTRSFAAIEEQLEDLTECFFGRCSKPVRTTYDAALLAHLARATQTAFGVVRLCESGLGDLAMMATLLLGEIMVSAYWMSLEQDERADQFARFGELERFQSWELVGRRGWRDELPMPAPLGDTQRVEQIKREFSKSVRG